MYILGIDCFFHDAAACLLKNGKIVAAAEEERFNRIKHTGEFPVNSIKYCLKKANIKIEDIAHIAYFWKPYLMLKKRFLGQFLRYFPASLRFLGGRKNVFLQMIGLKKKFKEHFDYLPPNLHFIEHHMAHAASSFFISPFEKSAILSIDGAGEWKTTLMAHGEYNKINVLKTINYPHSLGLLYGAVTEYLGFKELYDEGKVMSLAAYGNPSFLDKFKGIIKINPQGNFKIDTTYFSYHIGDITSYISNKFIKEFGPCRKRKEELNQRHKDIAASLQKILEETVIKVSRHLYKITKSKNLSLSGGVALNCVANTKILEKTPFENVFIQPAANDAGTALGSALFVYHAILGNPRNYVMKNAFLGPAYNEEEYKKALEKFNLPYQYHKNIAKVCAKLLAEGKIIGWFQGKMEFGPRALGNRSILADPRDPKTKEILDKKVKHRESFRPYAPSILKEKCGEYFFENNPSPFMLKVYNVLPEKKDKIPAVIHIDGTSRIQTVNKQSNSLFWNLIKEFEHLTSIPLILNTSFNTAGEPIVCSPEDAIQCFLKNGIDCLIMGNFVVEK